MRIKTNDIKDFLKQVRKFIPASKLNNFELLFNGKEAILTSSDLVITLMKQIQATGNSFEGAALNIWQIEQAIEGEKEDIEISQNKNEVTIGSKRIRTGQINCKLNNKTIPEDSSFIPVPKEFTSILKKAYKFSSSDETKEFIRGVHINKGHIIATDGHNLIVSKLKELANIESVTIANNLIKKLKKGNPIIGIHAPSSEQNPRIVYLKLASGEIIYAKAVLGEFPDFKMVIPKGEDWIEVKKEALLSFLNEAKSKGSRISVIKTQKDG
ncbi:hypothetical protein ACFL2K_05400, partial [Candidatus Margulisiibacteriota bacterium]